MNFRSSMFLLVLLMVQLAQSQTALPGCSILGASLQFSSSSSTPGGLRYSHAFDVNARAFKMAQRASTTTKLQFECACLTACSNQANCSNVFMFFNGTQYTCYGLLYGGPVCFQWLMITSIFQMSHLISKIDRLLPTRWTHRVGNLDQEQPMFPCHLVVGLH